MKTLITILLAGLLFCSCHKEQDLKITEYVNPFIGTGGHGHCFPGATVPFGGIQLSPNNPRSGSDWYSGYHYNDSIISSFSHTHLSGTNIGNLQDILLLPVITTPGEKENAQEYVIANYARFSHDNEKAEPGYYSVRFDNGIQTELSATPRCGIHYYQYPDNSTHALIIDLTTAQNCNTTTENCLKKVDDRTIQGYRKSTGCENGQRVYYTIEFSQNCRILAGKDTLKPLENGHKVVLDSCYAWIDFGKATNKILVKVSLSSANIDGASANLKKELPHWSFDKVKRDARQSWKRELGKIKAESKNEENLKIFYTALYHAYLAPNIFSDVNGNFKGADREVHTLDNKGIQYTMLPLWYTFRLTHPLFTITQKKRVADMINSMLRHYDATGLLPAWEIRGNETGNLSGNHAISVITEAYLKGIRDFDTEKAYEAMRKTILSEKEGLKLWRTHKYIPYGKVNEPVNETLEYSYDDWCMAQMAKALGKEEDYLFFLNSSRNYANLFNKDTGFMVPKSENGEWVYHPVFNCPKSNFDQYIEGSPWRYSWFVPHDIPGLISLHGDSIKAGQKLDSLFCLSSGMKREKSTTHVSDGFGKYVHGNEPSYHMAYLYNYTGQPEKTQYCVDRIRSECYSAAPNGLCDNEDCGQLSAWYVFSALGFYPVNPASGQYQLGTPLFDKVTLKVGPEKKFTIIAHKDNDRAIYVRQVTLNGEPLNRSWITHDEIMQGGELEFTLSDQPLN